MTLGTFSFFQEHVEPKIITNDDVLGDPIPYDQQDSMRHTCYQLFDLTPSVCNQQNFVFMSYYVFLSAICSPQSILSS